LALLAVVARHGEDQSHQPEPLNMLSVLTLHDAVELFLQLAAEHVGAQVSERTLFPDYFALIDKQIAPQSLIGRSGMLRLSRVRRDFKHAGIRPHPDEIETCRDAVAEFLAENCRVIFGVELATISLAFVIHHEDVRGELQRADECLGKADFEEATARVAIAFALLLRKHGVRGEPETASFTAPEVRPLIHALLALEHELDVLASGFDRTRLRLFRTLTPRVAITLDGKPHLTWLRQAPTSATPVRFCYDFVIEVGLLLQERETLLRRLIGEEGTGGRWRFTVDDGYLRHLLGRLGR
jgi:hypothetical protein